MQIGMLELFLDWSIPGNYLKLAGTGYDLRSPDMIGAFSVTYIFCQLIPRLGRLHRYNFSPRVRTASGYLHQYETCIKIVRW